LYFADGLGDGVIKVRLRWGAAVIINFFAGRDRFHQYRHLFNNLDLHARLVEIRLSLRGSGDGSITAKDSMRIHSIPTASKNIHAKLVRHAASISSDKCSPALMQNVTSASTLVVVVFCTICHDKWWVRQ
jgi:fructose-1-phosphate kinase PfkB-like protein